MYPFLTYSTKENLGRAIQSVYSRGDNDNSFDNKKIIAEMVALRKKRLR